MSGPLTGAVLASTLGLTVPALSPWAAAGLGLAVGLIAGGAYFASLWWNTQLYLAGGRALLAVLVQMLRFTVLLVALAGLALFGAMALLMGAAGLLLARALVLRRLGRQS